MLPPFNNVSLPASRITALLAMCLLCATACESPLPVPKERAFPRVEFPERGWQPFSNAACGFTFEYPAYAEIRREAQRQPDPSAHPCWFDVYIPAFDARLHCSYFPITAAKGLEKLKDEAFDLADWHNKRANYIDELPISRPEQRVYGFAFDIDGAAASPFQFYVTDSTQHFLRGALYFNTQARPDSLAPVTAFVKEDLLHIIGTLQWH